MACESCGRDALTCSCEMDWLGLLDQAGEPASSPEPAEGARALVPAGAPAEGIEAAYAPSPPSPTTMPTVPGAVPTHDLAMAAIPWVHVRGVGYADALVYRDRIALVRRPKTSPMARGALIGFLLGCLSISGWLGLFIGRWLGARISADGNRARIEPLRWTPAAEHAADPRNHVLPFAAVRKAQVWCGRARGKATLDLVDGVTLRIRWENSQCEDVDAGGVIAYPLRERAVVRYQPPWRHGLKVAGGVLLAVAWISVLAMSVVGGQTEPAMRGVASSEPGAADATSACLGLNELMVSLDGREPTFEEIVQSASANLPAMERAAHANPDYVAAAESLRWFATGMPIPPGLSEADLIAFGERHGSNIDAVCSS